MISYFFLQVLLRISRIQEPLSTFVEETAKVKHSMHGGGDDIKSPDKENFPTTLTWNYIPNIINSLWFREKSLTVTLSSHNGLLDICPVRTKFQPMSSDSSPQKTVTLSCKTLLRITDSQRHSILRFTKKICLNEKDDKLNENIPKNNFQIFYVFQSRVYFFSLIVPLNFFWLAKMPLKFFWMTKNA